MALNTALRCSFCASGLANLRATTVLPGPDCAPPQERDPRAYQILFSPGQGGGTFVGCTPERLYARTGAYVACVGGAGTRPGGPPGGWRGGGLGGGQAGGA